MTLEKEENTPAGLWPQEMTLLRQLFPATKDRIFMLTQANRNRLTNANSSINGFLRDEARGLVRRNNIKFMLPAAAIYLLGAAALFLFRGDYLPGTMIVCGIAEPAILMLGGLDGKLRQGTSAARGRHFALGLAPTAVAAAVFIYSLLESGSLIKQLLYLVQSFSNYWMLLLLAAIVIFQVMAKKRGHKYGSAAITILKLVLAAMLGRTLAFITLIVGIGGGPLPILLFMLAAGVFSAARSLLEPLTQKGSDLLNGVEGLRLYMTTAEKSRLEMLNPPEETPQLFERLLPYALVLEVADTWANRFEKVLREAQYEPQWYVGPSGHMFTGQGMNGRTLNRLSSNLRSQLTSSMKPPLFSRLVVRFIFRRRRIFRRRWWRWWRQGLVAEFSNCADGDFLRPFFIFVSSAPYCRLLPKPSPDLYSTPFLR